MGDEPIFPTCHRCLTLRLRPHIPASHTHRCYKWGDHLDCHTAYMYATTKAAVFSGRGRDGWIRTSECRRQRPMPYRLATPPQEEPTLRCKPLSLESLRRKHRDHCDTWIEVRQGSEPTAYIACEPCSGSFAITKLLYH